ncbi:DUF58 domain-containing protein [Marmoricola sp. RAF53]|uniref:DUF58 domain-containing protein n=1 Tax=Marmoricola sp. RAF53 TaxID=3233059 RepID=UPI003F949FBF
MTALSRATSRAPATGAAARPRPEAFKEALGSFTNRGRGFVAGGVAASLCGIVLGERDLVRIGFVVLLLPVVAAFWVARSGNRLGLVRTLSSTQIEVGQSSTVHLEITNVGPTTGLLLVEEQLPWVLGSRPRFVVDAMRPRRVRRIDYQVRAEQRGRYEIGPLRLRVGDPTGMVELQRSFTRTAALVVIPAAEPLPAIPLHGAWTGSGDNRPRPFASGSAADVMVREYRRGDDLRRVHWRSTARTGELMVRREEQPWQSRCTLLIDNRERAHRGHGPDSSLERAVTVTASIAVHLASQGFQVRLVSALGDETEHGWHDDDVPLGARPVLERLAVLPATPTEHLHTGWIDESVTAGMLIAVVGALDDHDRALLARLHHRNNAASAIVLDVDSWLGRVARAANAAAPAGDRPALAPWLRQRGWKASSLARGESLPAAWQELGR